LAEPTVFLWKSGVGKGYTINELMRSDMKNSAENFFTNLEFELGEPAPGKLLISEPFLYDPSFSRSVVFLVEHNEEGSVGFILNKPIELGVSEALDDFPDFDGELYFGGPVSPNNLFYIHTLGDQVEGSKLVMDGIYWGGDFDRIKFLIASNQLDKDQILFFAGYSGWSPDQLDNELEEKSWIVTDGRYEHLFERDPAKLWTSVLKGMGINFAIMSSFPEYPSMN